MLVSKLLKNCTILYDCRNCIFLAMHHMDKVSFSVMNELLVCNKMSSCGYDEFHTHSATIWKMTDKYFAKICVLKEDLEKELQNRWKRRSHPKDRR